LASHGRRCPPELPSLGASNWRVRVLRQLQQGKHREATGLTLLEGRRLVQTALAAGAEPALVVVDEANVPDWVFGLADRRGQGEGCELFKASDSVMSRLSPSVSPPGVVAAVKIPRLEIPQPPFAPDFTVLCLDEVADPGNAGTLIRTAVAAGARAVVGIGGVDLWGPKVLRAAMGSSFQLPVLSLLAESGPDLLADLRKEGCRLIAASPHARDSVWEANLLGPCALVLGNEAWGLRPEVERLTDLAVAIPLAGGVESLNVAQAGTLILFEIRRQKQQAPGH